MLSMDLEMKQECFIRWNYKKKEKTTSNEENEEPRNILIRIKSVAFVEIHITKIPRINTKNNPFQNSNE